VVRKEFQRGEVVALW